MDWKEDKWVNRNMNQTIYTAWLDQVPGLGSRSIYKIMALFEDAEKVYKMEEADLSQLVGMGVITNNQKSSFMNYREKKKPEEIAAELGTLGIKCVGFYDEDYPTKLREIQLPPLNLYIKGKLPDEHKPALGIVGARLCSDYGRLVARKYGEQMAAQGIQVISGMALGIDGIAQKATMEKGGSSYGILGCGVDICYPDENRALYEKLILSGGVISEYPPGVQPKSGLFPMRNRIISGLSDGLLVVEAREKSGTLITVDRALEQGKEVWAVPGKVVDRLSLGCNRLISQGAGIALSPREVADALWEMYQCRESNGSRTNDMRSNEAEESLCEHKPALNNATQEERLIYEYITNEYISVDELLDRLRGAGADIDASELYTILMNLKMRGYVKNVGSRFCVNL